MDRRSALKRKTPLKAKNGLARSAIKPKAKRKGGRARPNEPLAAWCEAQIPGVCLGRATHRHHKLRRSQGGTDDFDNTIDLCGEGGCHSWIHAHPTLSYERGWMVHRT